MSTRSEILQRPFTGDEVRQRPGRNGETVTYVDGATIVQRLLEAFDEWSFCVERHEILDEEILVLGKLRAGGVEKMAFGGSSITRARDDRRAVSLVDDVKAAETDSLKRCARLFGVALTLHAASSDAPRAAPGATPPSQSHRLLSGAQLRAIHAIRRKAGWSEIQLADYAKRVAGNADVEQFDKRTASTFIETLQAEVAPVGASR